MESPGTHIFSTSSLNCDNPPAQTIDIAIENIMNAKG